MLISLNINESNAQEKYLNIDKKVFYITKYNKNIIEKIKSWELKVHIKDNENSIIEVRNNRILIKTKDYYYSWNNNLIIDYNWKIIDIPLKIDIKYNKYNFDIFSKLYKPSLQKKALSCESAAAADIVSTLLVNEINEDEIIEAIPKNQFYYKLPEEKNGNLIWWNPNEWFVWYIDHTQNIFASQRLMTWYWVYEKPLDAIYNSYNLKTKILWKEYWNEFWTINHLSLLLEEIKNWNMVQLWWDWCTDSSYEDGIIQDKKDLTDNKARVKINAKNYCPTFSQDRSIEWYYEDDNWELLKHIGLRWEHSFILLWRIWDIDNPDKIKVWDTDTGYHIYDIKEWMRKWSMMDYRSIIIYKK